MIRVCVDVMGGDEPPEVVLEGIAQALDDFDDIEVLAVGPADIVEPFCAKHPRSFPLVATEVIAMDEHPADAVRSKRDSSIVRGCEAVKAGEAQAFFSAGSTGAVLAAATLKVGRIKGVTRPALITPIPGLDGHKTAVLDLGANADCKPEMLVQFAQMGSAYAQVLLGAQDPQVAMLNNGTEDTKGSEDAVFKHDYLAEHNGQGYSFVGNCEGVDVLLGNYDVIVTDGFTGNVCLKTLEGTAKYIVKRLKAGVEKSKRVAIGALMVKPVMKDIADDLSGEENGGAMLLGVKSPVFIGHGATSARAVRCGIAACRQTVLQNLVEKVAERCAQLV